MWVGINVVGVGVWGEMAFDDWGSLREEDFERCRARGWCLLASDFR